MNINDAKIGLEVVKSKGDYVVGRIGKIEAIYENTQRVHVKWYRKSETTVAIDAVEPTSIPYMIKEMTFNEHGRRISWPKYIRK